MGWAVTVTAIHARNNAGLFQASGETMVSPEYKAVIDRPSKTEGVARSVEKPMRRPARRSSITQFFAARSSSNCARVTPVKCRSSSANISSRCPTLSAARGTNPAVAIEMAKRTLYTDERPPAADLESEMKKKD